MRVPFRLGGEDSKNRENALAKPAGSFWGILSQTTLWISFSDILEKSSSLVTSVRFSEKQNFAIAPFRNPFGQSLASIRCFFRKR